MIELSQTKKLTFILCEYIKGVGISEKISENAVKFFNVYLDFLKKEKNKDIYLEKLFEIFTYKKEITPVPLCGKILTNKNTSFKCFTCFPDEHGLICEQCFRNGSHEGHYFMKINSEGSCDCGNEEYMKDSGFCLNHQAKNIKDFQVNEQKTKVFVRETKFAFFLLLQLYLLTEEKQDGFFQLCQRYSLRLMQHLAEFNHNSMVSNRMTYLAFSSPYEEFYPQVKGFSVGGHNILGLVWKLEKLPDTDLQRKQLFISLFTIDELVEELVLSYIDNFNNSPTLILSDLSSLAFYVFQQKSTKNAIEKNRMRPLIYQTSDELCLEQTFKSFFTFASYFQRMSKNKEFLEFQFMNSSISLFGDYQQKTSKNREENINQYWYEYSLVNKLTNILKAVKDNKKILQKMIKDCLIKSYKIKKPNYFLSCQRTLSHCLLVYCNGDLDQLFYPKFLEAIGLKTKEKTVEIVNHILISMRETLILYCYCLSNQQTIYRYYQFWEYVFNRLPVLMSLDLFLMRFCFGVLRQVGGSLQRFVGSFVQVAAEALEEENLQQHSSLNYDRKKGCGFLCAAVGLLMEAACCDLCSFTMVTELGTHSRGDARRVYGSLLASVEPIKLSDFVRGLSAFSQEKLFFEDFLQACTTQDAGKLCLSPDSRCRPFSLKYLKSKKTSKAFSEMLQLNEKKVDEKKVELDAAPALVSGAADFRQLVFSEAVVDEVVTLVEKYLGALVRKPELLDVDTGNVTLLVEELARLLGLVPSRRITAFLDSVLCCEVGRGLPEGLRRHLQQLVGKKVETDEAGQQAKKDRLQQKKAEKLKEMKARRGKFLEKQEVAEEEVEPSKCIICKVHVAGEPLAFMSLVRKSNTFARQHLNSSGGSFCVSSCNHLIHAKCYRQFYNPFEHNYCKFCSSGSNILIFLDPSKKNIMLSLEQIQTMTVILEKNYTQAQEAYQIKEVHEFSVLQKLIESIALSILQGILWDPEFYFRQQHHVHHLLFKFLRNLGGIDVQGLKEKIDEQMKEGLCKAKDFEDQSRKGRQQEREGDRVNKRREHDKEYSREKNIEQKQKRDEKREESKEQSGEQSKEQKSQQKEMGREQGKEGKQNRQKSKKQKQNQKQKQPVLVGECWAGYRFLVQRLLLLVKDKSEGMEDEAWSLESLEQQLSPGFRERLEEAVHLLQQELKEEEVQELAGRQPLSRPALTRLPESLAELAKEIGKCPNCSDLTNELAKCLLCGFKSCLSCKVCGLRQHVLRCHSGSSVFVRLDNGKPVEVSLAHMLPAKTSLYKNFLGEAFELRQPRDKYFLDLSPLNELRKKLTRSFVEIELIKKQKNSN